MTVATRPIRAAIGSDAIIGVYPAADFRLTTGRCTDCPTIPAALWYFEQETIAVPGGGKPVAGYGQRVDTFDDVRTWAAQHSDSAPIDW